MAAYIIQVLGDRNPTTLPEVAVATYIKARHAAWRTWRTADAPLASPPPADLPAPLCVLLQLFLHRRSIQSNATTAVYFCRWLGHSNFWVRRLSLRGLAVLLWGEMSRWTKQMAVLRALNSVEDGSTTLSLMNLVKSILPAVLNGEETFSRLLGTIYVKHMAHEDKRVRAAAIHHLCHLRSELPGPQLMGDALSEVVHILLHVDEEEVVATAAKAALTQLLPGVNWKVAPEQFNVHHLLDQAARYVTKRYNTNDIRQAALLCTLLPPDTLPAVSRVAALFVGLKEMGSSDQNVELRIAATISAEAVNQAYLDQERRGCFGRCRRRQRHPHGFPH
ncbi:hypothetical protein lerEdw1_019906 [Lerista edwardsae]|nr:hypothetical protein lerEdw1_019906 [Lerista edwardsae]